MRGWLQRRDGVKLTDVHWYQAGANAPGRNEKVELDLPAGVKLTRVADKSLSEMLAAGEIDCAIIARPPTASSQGHPDVVRLFPNYLEMEESYYERTKVWPIMHIIAHAKARSWMTSLGRPQSLQRVPESKRRSIERILDPAVSRYPLPWLTTYARKMRDLFRRSLPLWIEENRPTWEQMAALHLSAGHRTPAFKPEEIFPKGIMTAVRV